MQKEISKKDKLAVSQFMLDFEVEAELENVMENVMENQREPMAIRSGHHGCA